MKQLAKPALQQGAATLVVVMVLFIVMALLAAYANRSLLFEQRIAATYSRATLAQEVGEASVEWAVTMLNGPAVDGACQPADAPTGQRFVDRYFKVSNADRGIAPVEFEVVQADCTRAGAGWTCRCPAATKARVTPAPVAGAGLVPSFGLSFKDGGRPGVIQLLSQGCTDSVVDNCMTLSRDNTFKQQGTSLLSTQLSLVSAVRAPPAAPLVARDGLASDGGLGLHNTDPRTGGMLFVLGGMATGLTDSRLESLPGTPVEAARIEGDNGIKAGSGADVFRMFMGMARTRYVNHPALHVVTCAAHCNDALKAAYTRGWRMLWVNGAMTLGDGMDVGTEADPVVVIANGAVTLTGGMQMTGMLVSLGQLTWTNTTAVPSVITGTVLVDGAVATTGTMDILYRQTVADQLRNRLGSFVRVPGGWIDE